MRPDRYTARIAATVIAQNASYADLLCCIVRYTVEAAVARSADRYEWEHEELRRHGLQALDVAVDGRAIWCNGNDFEVERTEAYRQGAGQAFDDANVLDAEFGNRLDADLRARWRLAGYDTETLTAEMRPLFSELEADAADRAAKAREGLVAEIAQATSR